jgi:hypothetical protein
MSKKARMKCDNPKCNAVIEDEQKVLRLMIGIKTNQKSRNRSMKNVKSWVFDKKSCLLEFVENNLEEDTEE